MDKYNIYKYLQQSKEVSRIIDFSPAVSIALHSVALARQTCQQQQVKPQQFTQQKQQQLQQHQVQHCQVPVPVINPKK